MVDFGDIWNRSMSGYLERVLDSALGQRPSAAAPGSFAILEPSITEQERITAAMFEAVDEHGAAKHPQCTSWISLGHHMIRAVYLDDDLVVRGGLEITYRDGMLWRAEFER